MPNYYSFVGSSVVYIALNYFFMLSFMCSSFNADYIDIPTFLDEFVLYFTDSAGPSKSVVLSRASGNALNTIISSSVSYSWASVRIKRFFMLFLALAALGVYSGTSYRLADEGHKMVATIDSIFIVVFDLMYQALDVTPSHRLYLYTKLVDSRLMYARNGIVMLLYRAAVSVFMNYWVLGHAVGYLALGLLLVHSMVDFLYPVVPSARRVPKQRREPGEYRCRATEAILAAGGFVLLSGAFLADMFAASIGYAQAKLYQITFEK
ncbi:MAG: hypothetical protein P4M11_07610 [Candidatus Pacebacteria bacterium]|nr:hypothetical protein [Candidatus Paceibacterota bacterium]